MAESEQSADIYDRVYAAERPELFFKSAAWRVSGPGQPVSVRADSTIDVPEPELAVVLNAEGAVAGYTICNDMSSRSIEGENPLYLPQAKIYLGGCAVGPWIVPAWEVPDPYALTIELTIARDGAAAWEGSASTAALHRKFHELAAYLFRADDFPAGVILATGTSVVPDLPFTLEGGDEVHIRISGIGHLINPVVRGKPAVSLLPVMKCGCRVIAAGCRVYASYAAGAITNSPPMPRLQTNAGLYPATLRRHGLSAAGQSVFP
jgi:2-dehydro-3-deoxy-D-arabinonate dehydratase